MYITREIEGYKWQSINAANSANATAKGFYGIPVSPEAITQEVIEPQISLKQNGDIDFYYYEGVLEPLGNSSSFTIRIETP